MKEHDVYKATWKDTEGKYDPHWCFDGQMVVGKRSDGAIILYDTYWSQPSDKYYTLEKARELFNLVYVCNLTEVEKFDYGDPYKYFKEEDVFNLSHQHGSYKKVMVRKGVKRDPRIMRESLLERRERCEWEIDHLQDQIKHIDRDLEKIEGGDIDNIFL